MVPIICVLNHERISWVSIEIYYHDNFVFGHIFMFLTSIYCNLPYLRIPQSHKYTKRMTDYEPRSTNPLSGSTSYIYKMR